MNMTKNFSRHRLSQEKKRKKCNFCTLIIAAIGLILLLALFPILRIMMGPFGSFLFHIGKFWNSTTLILFQNEAELRPSGGFISAIGILEIKNGIPHLTVKDSYSIENPPDSVRAPDAIEKIFSDDPKYRGWVFRDSNFSPDFPESAQKALEFVQYDPQFSKKNFDAVVAINFETIRLLFNSFGPINGMTGDTLFLSLQRTTKNIDLHSTEDLKNRKNTLNESAKDLMSTIGYFHLPDALKIVADSADRKDVQMWFADHTLQKIVEGKKWDGTLPLENFFLVNIANLGAKKSDRYLYKHYFSDITVDSKGRVEEKFTIQFHHRGGENLSSGPGYYFIRVYRPYDTRMKEPLSSQWSQKSVIGQYEEFSHYVFLHPGETKIVSIDFIYPQHWLVGKRSMHWVAQSGSMDDLNLSIRTDGDTLISGDGCDWQTSRENVFFCSVGLNSDYNLSFYKYSDTLTPILESIRFENNREIAVRFSEPISSEISESHLLIQCKDKDYSSQKIFRNEEYPRDVRVVLSDSIEFSNEFCKLYWENVSDEYGNTTNIEMTIPLRLP